jgi:iron complex transport system substrate-binding protein
MRIVSLLPSATETICALGLADQLVGVTHECDYPPFVRDLPKVTETLIPTDASSAEIDGLVRERLDDGRALYALDLPVLESLRPDLIVTQALCDVCAVAEAEVKAAACTLPGAPRVLNLEPESLGDVFAAMRQVAEAAGVAAESEGIVRALEARVEEVVGWAPEVVVIACCGFSAERTLDDLPLLRAVPGWDTVPAVRAGRVYVVDGSQYFSRPGPRLVDSLEILAHAIDRELHPLPAGLPSPIAVAGVGISHDRVTP